MNGLASVLTLIVLLPPAPVGAQLASPNAAGVSMGHLHYVVRDVEAHRKFWMDFGATSVQLGNREVLKLPDVFIFLDRGETSGGTEGSVVNHVAFRLPEIPKALARFRSPGVRVLPRNPGVAGHAEGFASNRRHPTNRVPRSRYPGYEHRFPRRRGKEGSHAREDALQKARSQRGAVRAALSIRGARLSS